MQEIRELGTGGFATVFLAKWRGQDVAVKKMKSDGVGIDQFEEFCQEMTLMRYVNNIFFSSLRRSLAHFTCSRLNHPNIVKYLASFAQPLAIVLELVPFGGLDGLIRKWQGALL